MHGETVGLVNVGQWTIYCPVEGGQLSVTRIGKQSLHALPYSVDKSIAENRVDR